ncbi:MAG: TetR/AcrR family transcriptional regulator [Erysipelotrichaceae bacterium]
MRKHYTKPYIEEALLEILKHRPFESITVSEVVKKAGVSRASFYRNYLDLKQVINEYVERVFDKQIGISANMKESICQMLQHYFEHREILLLLDKNKLLGIMNNTLYDTTLKEINQLNVFNNRYQPYFFAGAAAGFIRGWIEHGFEESPEVMADLFIKSLEGYLKVE